MATKTQPAKLHPKAHARLKELAKELRSRGFPQEVKQQEVLSALVLYTSVPQLAGMLTEYWRYTDKLEKEEEATPERP